MEGEEVDDTIIGEITKLEADHVVLGNHHYGGLHNYLFGSVGMGLVKNLECPLTLISADTRQ